MKKPFTTLLMLAASLVSCTACSDSAEAATAAGDDDGPTNGEF